MEDLDPDFAYEIFENFNAIKEFKTDIARLKLNTSQTEDLLVNFVKDENIKFRAEVRNSIKEQFEYMKEVHTQVENSIKQHTQEYQQMTV